MNGDALCRTIGNMSQESWSGIDLIIHCGGSVDLSLTLQDALSTLARAEVLQNQHGQHVTQEYNRLLQLAEEQLRDSYRWHWSSSQSAANMSHGSHLFCCCSVLVDLLVATHYSSLGNLMNDFSRVSVWMDWKNGALLCILAVYFLLLVTHYDGVLSFSYICLSTHGTLFCLYNLVLCGKSDQHLGEIRK